MGQVQFVRTTATTVSRAVRARVGMLEGGLGRPDDDWNRGAAMNVLGNELSGANHQEAALSVREAEMARLRRLGAPVHHAACRAEQWLAVHINTLDGLNRPIRCRKTCAPDV